MNDWSYACLAKGLALTIAEAAHGRRNCGGDAGGKPGREKCLQEQGCLAQFNSGPDTINKLQGFLVLE